MREEKKKEWKITSFSEVSFYTIFFFFWVFRSNVFSKKHDFYLFNLNVNVWEITVLVVVVQGFEFQSRPSITMLRSSSSVLKIRGEGGWVKLFMENTFFWYYSPFSE